MTGSAPQKVCRLLAHLLTHPSTVPRYLRKSLVTRKTPLDFELPWMSFAVIDFLAEYLKPHMTVFEYGSGGSTLFFARRTSRVFSVEDNPEWHSLVQDRIEKEGLLNATIQLKPFDFWNPDTFDRSEYLNALPSEPFDVYVVDGQEGSQQVRPTCFHHIEKNVKPGAIIVIDDSWRYISLRTENRAKKVESFVSVGPCRMGVTSTDVYFY
ncbi:MAG: class I SAM-dependent methyltransferase [Candidatus Hydrogenedentes bacterium]|nr:class I SAM-dependent methyltransferase [Candidatus Hydrogenedentota bacterium]